jgi:hypothetical protein
MYPNWDFWFENEPPGNPGGQAERKKKKTKKKKKFVVTFLGTGVGRFFQTLFLQTN